jgi:hypothetical protein
MRILKKVSVLMIDYRHNYRIQITINHFLLFLYGLPNYTIYCRLKELRNSTYKYVRVKTFRLGIGN